MVGKKKLVNNVNNIASYTVLYNSANILCRGPSGSSVIKRVRLICEETKGHACRYLKTMKESINLAFHAKVIVEGMAVEVAELKDVSL